MTSTLTAPVCKIPISQGMPRLKSLKESSDALIRYHQEQFIMACDSPAVPNVAQTDSLHEGIEIEILLLSLR